MKSIKPGPNPIPEALRASGAPPEAGRIGFGAVFIDFIDVFVQFLYISGAWGAKLPILLKFGDHGLGHLWGL